MRRLRPTKPQRKPATDRKATDKTDVMTLTAGVGAVGAVLVVEEVIRGVGDVGMTEVTGAPWVVEVHVPAHRRATVIRETAARPAVVVA